MVSFNFTCLYSAFCTPRALAMVPKFVYYRCLPPGVYACKAHMMYNIIMQRARILVVTFCVLVGFLHGAMALELGSGSQSVRVKRFNIAGSAGE